MEELEVKIKNQIDVQLHIDEQALAEIIELKMREFSEFKQLMKNLIARIWNASLLRTTCWQDTTQQSPDVLSWTFQTHWSLDR